MKKCLYLIAILFIFVGMTNSIFAKEEYTNLSDPKNTSSNQKTLTTNRGDYTYLSSTTEDFNGMAFAPFSLDCRGEDYLEIEGGAGGYALAGNGTFIHAPTVGKYSSIQHNGINKVNYSKTQVGWTYECTYKTWDEENEVEIFCSKYGTTWNETRYKAYTKEMFENEIKPYRDSSWCSHASESYKNFVTKYEIEKIRNSQSSKVEYYVHGGMPVNIPAFTLVTSINPGNSDLWVATFSPDSKLGLYNVGVYQTFDSTSAHIKHTATPLTSEESSLIHTTEIFEDVERNSLEGKMYYGDKRLAQSVYQYFLACNTCTTCERCITKDYGELNTYVAYGEIPEFYLSRGCPVHSCCFVYDYPIVLPDEFEGIKCPDLKLEGDKYPACENHTCKRWLTHSDYRENFAPQTCLKVISGRVITDTGSGVKEIKYTGPVDEGLISLDNGNSYIVIDGGYSDYCANHMCNAFFCAKSCEDSESYASKYNKQQNSVEMANKYCSEHKLGCKVVTNYLEQPTENGGVGETIVEQIEKDKQEGKYSFCDQKVTQTFYAYIQPDTMICEGCYDKMAGNSLNSDNNNFDVGKCPNCGDFGVNKFVAKKDKWCATCIDFNKYLVVHRNMVNYDYTDILGMQRENRCEFNVQRFAGDSPALCGERCVKERRYCYWHLCNAEGCANPVKYSGAYFCEQCVPGR